MEVLIINGTDYSDAIATKGYGWSRNDLDSDKTTRTKDGKMRRDKITTKRKLSYTTRSMPRDKLAKLDDDLNKTTCTVKYLDLHGVRTSTFTVRRWNARSRKQRTTMRCGAARRLI